MCSPNDDSGHEPWNENAPLLSQPKAPAQTFQPSFIPSALRAKSPRTILLLLFTTVFILSFGAYLMAIPSVRVFEDIICHHYYENLGVDVTGPDGNIRESLCKVDEIQERLNLLIAVLQFLSAGTGLILTIPYGIVADKIGAKFVFILSILGTVSAGIYNFTILYFWRTFPIRLMWLSPIITVLGGGQSVTNMTFYALGSGVSTDANR